MSINKTQLGKAIREIRELRGVSQAALGKESGLQANTVALIERGQRGVSLDALNALANALDVPAGCLTMLGTSKIKGDSESASLIKSIQDLILATIVAQTNLQAKEAASHAAKVKIRTVLSSPQLPALVKKRTTSKKAKRGSAAKRATKLVKA